MSLFTKQDRAKFLKLTYDRYASLNARSIAKKLGPLEFTVGQLRDWVLGEGNATPGRYDCTVRCRYCFRILTLAECDIDHSIPISRGGSVGFENMELICASCNDRKGSMTPTEFLALLSFLARELPLAMGDVLKRLGMANQLAAGVAHRRKKAKGVISGKDIKIN